MSVRWSTAESSIEEAIYLLGPWAQRREALIELLRQGAPRLDIWEWKDDDLARIGYSGCSPDREDGRNTLIFEIWDLELTDDLDHASVEHLLFALMGVCRRLRLLDEQRERPYVGVVERTPEASDWRWTFGLYIRPDWEVAALA